MHTGNRSTAFDGAPSLLTAPERRFELRGPKMGALKCIFSAYFPRREPTRSSMGSDEVGYWSGNTRPDPSHCEDEDTIGVIGCGEDENRCHECLENKGGRNFLVRGVFKGILEVSFVNLEGREAIIARLTEAIAWSLAALPRLAWIRLGRRQADPSVIAQGFLRPCGGVSMTGPGSCRFSSTD